MVRILRCEPGSRKVGVATKAPAGNAMTSSARMLRAAAAAIALAFTFVPATGWADAGPTTLRFIP